MVVENLEATELGEIRHACWQLFPGQRSGPDFLRNLGLDGVKRAYRQRAKAVHPDLGRGPLGERCEEFHVLNASYRLLSRYLVSPLFAGARAGRGAKVIAVGGAKGGIGKSIFAANLGVYLSTLGLKVVLADLDLGGANLHLYLGRRMAKGRNLNDFLKGRVGRLDEIATHTDYGPLLIGGDGSELGIANIHFARKLKLLKALRKIEADYVVLDLGGGHFSQHRRLLPGRGLRHCDDHPGCPGLHRGVPVHEGCPIPEARAFVQARVPVLGEKGPATGALSQEQCGRVC